MKIGDLVTINLPPNLKAPNEKREPKFKYLVTDMVDRGFDWRGRLILCKCRATWRNPKHSIVWKWTYDLEVVK